MIYHFSIQKLVNESLWDFGRGGEGFGKKKKINWEEYSLVEDFVRGGLRCLFLLSNTKL
jgi:hypothetical protein